MSFQRMVDLDLSGKRVLIRQDLNVPVKNGKVTSDLRIQASIPTIEKALAAGAAGVPMVCSGSRAISFTSFMAEESLRSDN